MNTKQRVAGKELRSSLNLVIIAIAFGMPFITVTSGPALSGYARAIGAGDFVYSVIFAMPVVGAVLQVFASYYIENTGKRKATFLISGFIHRLMWIPIAMVPFLIPEQSGSIRVWMVVALVAVGAGFSSITGVAYTSWMGSLVPSEIRGRFFSRRTLIYTITGGLGSLLAAQLLDTFRGFPGYLAVFVLVSILGAVDILVYIWIKDPPMEVPSERIPFLQLFKQPFSNRNYVKYMIFVSFWYFAANFSGPFFNVFMLEYLHMSFLSITLTLQIAAMLGTITFIRFWGRLIDIFGNKPVMRICCTVIIVLPFLWLFITPQNYWMAFFINFFGGAMWPGFEMTSMNLSIGLAPERNRSIYIANYTLIVAVIGSALAFLCGGAFMELSRQVMQGVHLPFLLGQQLNRFHILFAVSGTARLMVLLFIFKYFKEENARSAGEMLRNLGKTFKGKLGPGA